MTATTHALPMFAAIPDPLKKKRVLLVDMSSAKRDMRADVMRRLGMDVDCAADIGEARSWWRADLYNLVLMNVENELGRRDKFCDDMRDAIPQQQLAFLVGKPEYLAGSPQADEVPTDPNDEDQGLVENRAALATEISGGPPLRWGILEACRRISAVRAAADARTKLLRDRPAPLRDPETPRSNRTAESPLLTKLLGEELQ